MSEAQIKVEYLRHSGDDLAVVDAARCSFDKESDWEYPSQVYGEHEAKTLQDLLGEGFYYNEVGGLQRLKASDKKLIAYLAREQHTSPFNHCFLTVRVTAPVFVARQLVKHKFMPWNEVSRRYVKDEPEFYIPEGWRQAAENVKQGSAKEFISEGDSFFSPHERIKNTYKHSVQDLVDLYNEILEQGGCAEQARMVLPQSMMTTWIWSGSLGAFCDMLNLRLDSHTQYETRLVAQQTSKIVKELFPISYEALVKEG